MKRVVKITVIIALQVIAVLALLEVGLRVVAEQLPERLQIAVNYVETGEKYSPTTLDHSQTDIDHYFTLKVDLRDAVQEISPGERFTFSTYSLWGSRFGFRQEPIDYLIEMAAVGDSFTFCFTEDEDCWVRRFQTDTGLGVANLGQPATGSRSHLNILGTFVAPLEPRLVVWQFFGNDFNDDFGLVLLRGEIEGEETDFDLTVPPEPDTPEQIRWLRRNSLAWATTELALGNESPFMDDYLRLFDEPYRVSYRDGELRFGQGYELQVMNTDDPRQQIGIEQTRQSLATAKAQVEGWDGNFIVMIMPTRELVYRHLTEPIMGADQIAIHDMPRQAMLEICEELDLLCFDPLAQLQTRAQAGEHLYYTDDMHLNTHGNIVLAEMLWRWIGGYGLLYE